MYPTICMTICGDGLVIFPEICDAGSLPGCLPDCSGSQVNFDCTVNVSPSICTCVTGYTLHGSNCT